MLTCRHLTRNCHPLGLYSTNLSKEPFIVMMNAFPLNKGIAMHEVYDLKGSMHGREIKEKEKSCACHSCIDGIALQYLFSSL